MRRIFTFTPSRTVARIAVGVAVLSVAVGLWNVLVLHRRHPGLFWQVVFPLLVLRLSIALYRRSRAAAPPPDGA